MTTYLSARAFERERSGSPATASPAESSSAATPWSDKYRGATVEDLDPPPALSTNPSEPLVSALQSAYERDYTHLTVVSTQSRALLGYVAIPRARDAVAAGKVRESDPVANAMVRFDRRKKGAGGKGYTVITMDTPLEVLEQFFEGRLAGNRAGERNDFAVVTDAERKFVLGVVTREDLEEFVKRRPT